jgi:hypothetical protein
LTPRNTGTTIISLVAICILFSASIALADPIPLENNMDRPGSDYASFNLGSADPNLCAQTCAGDPDCKAFTFVKPGYQGPNARCWLKNGVPAQVPADCCVSGVKTAAPGGGDLTGVWSCDDGGKYYIRQLGNKIWWYGESNPNSPGWSNVMYGTISGNTIDGNWADVPKGGTLNNGMMKLKIESNNKLSAIQKTGGFGGSVWTR